MRNVLVAIVLIATASSSACLDDRRGRVAPDTIDPGEVGETSGPDIGVETEERVTSAQQGFVDLAVNTQSELELSDLCVTTHVINGAGELVAPFSACASVLGNGSSALSYVLTCDATAPRTTVRLWVDSITTKTGAQLRNPCPGEGHAPSQACTLEMLCDENSDVAVSFDLNLVR